MNNGQAQDHSDKVNFWRRLREAVRAIINLRRPDFRAAGTFITMQYGHLPLPLKWLRFLGWAWRQVWRTIPEVMDNLSIAGKVSRTPMWLIDSNPLANHPWQGNADAQLPREADTVVIGAGFTGGALAYQWSKRAPDDRLMVVLDMDDPASGSSGRNEGLVVMGRYFKQVHDTVLAQLLHTRCDLSKEQNEQLAYQFADRYCHAAYHNAELIRQTIETEGFDCDYSRSGWVQAQDTGQQQALRDSVQIARDSGFEDWSSIHPDKVRQYTGMQVQHDAGYSHGAASWHPAKWVWCLLTAATRRSCVQLYTRTKVSKVDEQGTGYVVHTDRGPVAAKHIVYATESYTPNLQKDLHDVIEPRQEQAASGDEGPADMKPHIGISGLWFFAGRYGPRVLFGSGGSRVPDHEAGRNQPSRFLTKFAASEMKRSYGPYRLHMTHEWSGTVGYTPDEYPIVGSIDGKGKYVIAGMCGSGSSVSFNGGRCIANRILALTDEADDYPPAYFAPSRLMAPDRHQWPQIESN